MSAPSPVSTDPSLDDMLCLALHQASRSMTSRYRPLLAQLGLTYPQYVVMVLLWQEGSMTVGGMGHRLRLESSTLSPLLKRLEALALIDRRRAPDDERSVVVSLTPAGTGMQARAAGVPRSMCDATGMDEDEHARLVARLRELVANLDASRPAP